MCSCTRRKGQWFLVGSAIIALVLAMLAHTLNYGMQATYERSNHDLLKDAQNLAMFILSNTNMENAKNVKKSLVLIASLTNKLAREKGYEANTFCFCSHDDMLYAFNAFNESVSVNLTTNIDQKQLSIDSMNFGFTSLNLDEFLITSLSVWNAEICVNQTTEADKGCGCILSFSNGRIVLLGKTLNLNWC